MRKESEKNVDEIDNDRSDYERQIDIRRHENEVLKHQLGLVSPEVYSFNNIEESANL